MSESYWFHSDFIHPRHRYGCKFCEAEKIWKKYKDFAVH